MTLEDVGRIWIRGGVKSDCVTLQFDLGHSNFIPNEASKGFSIHSMLHLQVYKEHSACDGSFVTR